MYFWNFFIEEKVVNIIKSDEVVYVVSDSVGETAEFADIPLLRPLLNL